MLTSILHAVVLGLIQGLAEFIPISSSGHLVLVPALFGLEPGGLSFNVALHLGTMMAVVVYMRQELWAIVSALIGRDHSPDALLYRRLGLFAIAASVPVGIVGLALGDVFERIFASPIVAAIMLLITGAMLLVGEFARDRRLAQTDLAVPAGHLRPSDAPSSASDTEAVHSHPTAGSAHLPRGVDASDPRGLSLGGMSLREAMLIGLAQCIALLPGISRSGTTIVAGMTTGLTREAATRFSFLLSLPALAGATVVSLPNLGEAGSAYPPAAVVAGIIAAFASGYMAIRVLIALVARDRLTGFAMYCFAAGIAALLALQFV